MSLPLLFIQRVAALDQTIREAGIPLDGIALVDPNSTPPVTRIDYRPEATVQQRTDGNAIVDGWDWSQGAHDLYANGLQRTQALAFLESAEGTYKLLRAAFDVTRDELNILRQWNQSFKSEVAAAASLADLKNRVALLPTLPDRTLLQFKNAVENKIGGGDVDGFAPMSFAAVAEPAPTGLMAKLKNFFIG